TLGSCLGRTGEELGPCRRARKTLRTTSCNPLHHQVLPAMHYERAWKRLYPPALLAGSAAEITQGFPADRRQPLPWDYFPLARDPLGNQSEPKSVQFPGSTPRCLTSLATPITVCQT